MGIVTHKFAMRIKGYILHEASTQVMQNGNSSNRSSILEIPFLVLWLHFHSFVLNNSTLASLQHDDLEVGNMFLLPFYL